METVKIKTVVWVTSQFEAFHRWKKAPQDVKFLRDYHRHLFHVKVGMEVNHGDREIEFFQFKRKLEDIIANTWTGKKIDGSCEIIAEDLRAYLGASFVTVSEDGENGATVSVEGYE